MSTHPDELDAAFGTGLYTDRPELQALLDTAEEITASLTSSRLSASERAFIRARMNELAGRSRTRLLRRLRAGRRAPAIVGGAALAAAAALGIGLAIARGRRHAHALAT